ncbi:HEPN domain-containing protein [Halomontanus rarus]|uniref:HEPN domain-containing protein n=1 Tax=Halomontanus rarus TaxID=3034020 RepID=UPI00293BFB97|nr:HEPN domain-containing protein [Halovivax sp. KZCA124]
MPADKQPGKDAVEDQLQQAQQALDDARGARNAELSDAVIINRLYYACFHATQAALYDRGLNPSSHGGVLSLFGSEIITAGEAPRERGRFLNRLSELRKQADYGYGTLDEDIDALLSRSEQFITEMEELCPSHE